MKWNTLYNLTSYKSCRGDFLPFQHPDFVLQGVFLAPKSFLVDDLDCVHLPILLWLCQPHLWKRAPEKTSCVIFCGVVKFCENVPLKTHLCFVASSCFVFGQRRYIRWWDYNYQADPQIGTIDAEKASWCITTSGILWPNGRPYLAPFEKMQTCGLFQNVHLQLLGHENCEKPSHKQKMLKPALFPCPFPPFSGNISSLQKIFANLTPGLFKGLRDRDHHPMWTWHGNPGTTTTRDTVESQAWQVFCVRNANQNERQKQGAGGDLFQDDFVWLMKIEEVQEMWKKKEIWRNMK